MAFFFEKSMHQKKDHWKGKTGMTVHGRQYAHRLFYYLTLFGLILSPHGALSQVTMHEGDKSEKKVIYDDVVVTGTRSPHALADVPVDTVLIRREEIERSSAHNLPQLLRNIPGIAATNLDDTISQDNLRLTMRGLQLNEGYGLILVNGQRVHGGLGAHGDYGVDLNQIPLNMIERVEIVKGASSALYGADAMAGVINIITRPVPDRTGGVVGVDYGIYDVMPRRGGAVVDSTRRREQAYASFGSPVGQASGLLLQLSRESDEGTSEFPQDTTRESVMGRWHTAFDNKWSISLGGDFSRARRETAITVTNARYDREFDDYRISGAVQYNDNVNSWTLSGYSFNQDFVQGYPGFAHAYRFGEIGYDQVESVYTWYGDRQWLTVGAEAQRQRMDYTINSYIEGDLASQVDVDRDIDTYSLFLQDEIFLADGRVTLVPGIRYEDHSTFGDEFNPKFSAAMRTGSETTWRTSVGRAFKSPTIRQLYYEGLSRHGEWFDQSNPDLSPERAINYNISVEHTFSGIGVWTTLGAFRTDLKDKVIRDETGEFADGIPIRSYENIDRARIDGIELSFQTGTITGFRLRGSGAWMQAKDRDTRNDLPFVPQFTASLIPGYITFTGRTGIETIFTAVGRQYRDAGNNNTIDSHQIVDLRIWHELTDRMTAAVNFGNIFESHKGEREFAHRQGRSLGLSVKGTF